MDPVSIQVRNKIQVWFSLVPVPGFMHIAPQAVCRYPGYIDGTGKARSHSKGLNIRIIRI